MAGAGYGKDVRQKMSTFKEATAGKETPEAKLAQRKTALTAAQTAMGAPGAAQSSRITNRLARINKAGKNPVAPPTPTTGTAGPTPTATTAGGGQPLPKGGAPAPSNIRPGEENAGKLGGALPPTQTGNTSTSTPPGQLGGALKKKKRQSPTAPPSPYQIT